MKKEIKKEEKKVVPPTNTKEAKEAVKKEPEAILEGVLKYKNGYAIFIDGKPKEIYPGSDAFSVASKRYSQMYK